MNKEIDLIIKNGKVFYKNKFTISNVIINKKVKNIFITENNENYLRSLAIKLK